MEDVGVSSVGGGGGDGAGGDEVVYCAKFRKEIVGKRGMGEGGASGD